MGRVKMIPVEVLPDVMMAVEDRLENLRDIVVAGLVTGEAKDEMEADIERLVTALEVLDS